jgi:hypothetical protein
MLCSGRNAIPRPVMYRDYAPPTLASEHARSLPGDLKGPPRNHTPQDRLVVFVAMTEADGAKGHRCKQVQFRM